MDFFVLVKFGEHAHNFEGPYFESLYHLRWKLQITKVIFFFKFQNEDLKITKFCKFIYVSKSTFQRSMFLEVLKLFNLVLFEHRHRNKANFLTSFKWFNLKLNFIEFKIH